MNIKKILVRFEVLLLFLVIVFAKSDAEEEIDMCNETDGLHSYKTDKSDMCGCTKTDMCVRKCCKAGFYHSYYENVYESIFTRNCTRLENSSRTFSVPIYDGLKILYELKDKFVIGMLNCNNPKWQYFKMDRKMYPKEIVYIQKNGSLYYPAQNMMYGTDRYCVDEEDGLTFYVCFSPYSIDISGSYLYTTIGTIISSAFLLITFLIYAVIPESNIRNKTLMNYVLALLLAYTFLLVVQLYPRKFGEIVCPILGCLIIFFFLISFFWINVMCIDVWITFRDMRGFDGRRRGEKKRFLKYFVYAVGVPSLHILVLLLFNIFGDQESYYFPGIGYEKCFLRDGYPNLFYFYGPMAILSIVNFTLFILTAVKIQKVKRETSALEQPESKRHSNEDDKQMFSLYVKLLFVMGIGWTCPSFFMDVTTWVLEWRRSYTLVYIWHVNNFCSAIYGLIIFYIFIYRKKIWRSFKK